VTPSHSGAHHLVLLGRLLDVLLDLDLLLLQLAPLAVQLAAGAVDLALVLQDGTAAVVRESRVG
jgi:hypothetical protein